MLKNDTLYYIDYQGGRKGSLFYDVASLLYDAKANIPDNYRQELLDYYISKISRNIKINETEFKSFSGKPMFLTSNFPTKSIPGKTKSPSLGNPKVTVQVAWTASPIIFPVSPSTPEGISTDSTGRFFVLSIRMSSR